MNKSNKQVIEDLVEVVVGAVSDHISGSTMMLTPAINILKVKLRAMDEKEADSLVDSIHQVSAKIEYETGHFSPYHCLGARPEVALTIPSE